MRIVFSPEALDDLASIAEWIARDNPVRADSFVDEIEDRCRSLASFSERFPVAGIVGDRSIRKLTHAGYLIFYDVDDEVIDILRIVHGSRDWVSFFDGA